MRYTVLTYIMGSGERLHEIRQKDPQADYVLITDDKRLMSRTWEVVYDHRLEGLSLFERLYAVRFNPFRYAKTDVVVRLDASIGINQSLQPIVDEFERGRYDRCLMIHPARNTMTEEYAEWVKCRKHPQKDADHCLKMMQQMGYDMEYRGLFQSCFEVVRRNQLNLDINAKTLDLLRQAATDGHVQRVNQTWLSMVINHYFSDRIKVLPVSDRIMKDGRMMTWYHHNHDVPLPEVEHIEPMMFNQPVTVWR